MYTLDYASLHSCLFILLTQHTLVHCTQCVCIGLCLIPLTTFLYCCPNIHWIMPHYSAAFFILLPQHTLLHCIQCVYIGLCLIALLPFYTAVTTFLVTLYTVFIHWIRPHYNAGFFIQPLQYTLLHCALCVYFGLCLITLPSYLYGCHKRLRYSIHGMNTLD